VAIEYKDKNFPNQFLRKVENNVLMASKQQQASVAVSLQVVY
jgi:hypothetical protein